ncbi:hypothetical protein PIB30_054946 [Stylosanthes scabra]|uniref:Uncharacterized protein n=1 Tax=Stylosanthes scabra TaxID=79078 RepID=A0ABU6ZHL5_9FABA|nr:hypothetical protein [Stylosanthes scabra]
MNGLGQLSESMREEQSFITNHAIENWMPYSQILDSKQASIEVARAKVTGRAAERARTRAAAQEAAHVAAEREPTSFNEVRFNSKQSYEKSKVVFERQILNERIIHFDKDDFMK